MPCPSCRFRSWRPSGTGVRAAQRGRGLPAGVGERELAQVREAELRVRGPGASRAWAKVLVDPVGGPAEDRRPSARGGRGGQGAPRDRPARRVRDDGGADHRGEREDLRGPPGGGPAPPARTPPGREGKRGLREALVAEKSAEIDAWRPRPIPATAVPGRTAGTATRPPSPATGRRSSIPCSGRSPCGAPGSTARTAGTAWPRATMSSASRARRCRPAWPR
jgi:hypothetical protein